jgi:hypothetical protein
MALSYIDRTTHEHMGRYNAYKAITGKEQKKIVLAGLWTS